MNKMIRHESNDVNEAYTSTLDVILTVAQIHALVRRIIWGLGRKCPKKIPKMHYGHKKKCHAKCIMDIIII